jgi:chromosome segregation ATPase
MEKSVENLSNRGDDIEKERDELKKECDRLKEVCTEWNDTCAEYEKERNELKEDVRVRNDEINTKCKQLNFHQSEARKFSGALEREKERVRTLEKELSTIREDNKVWKANNNALGLMLDRERAHYEEEAEINENHCSEIAQLEFKIQSLESFIASLAVERGIK